jgi:hypothetical protein
MHGCTEGGTLAGIASHERIVGTSERSVIAYYVSAHGYGHGVRSCDIIRAVNRLYPALEVEIISGLPGEFLISRTGAGRNTIRNASFDVGMVQIDSVQADVSSTLEKVEKLFEMRGKLIARETGWYGERGVSLVVADIPALPLEAAAAAGIPAMAIGSFGWDWIYSRYLDRSPRWKTAVEFFRDGYRKADLLLRLPFCEEMRAFPRREDIPLVASRGACNRGRIVEITGSDPDKKWILLSFTSLNLNREALDEIERIDGYEFFTMHPLVWKRKNIHCLRRDEISFSDLTASVDAVISKPGFGILSDCVVHEKPLIYAERRDFAEYDILESAIRKYLKHIRVPLSVLYSGRLRESIDGIWSRPAAPESLPAGGAEIAARKIASLAGIQDF